MNTGQVILSIATTYLDAAQGLNFDENSVGQPVNSPVFDCLVKQALQHRPKRRNPGPRGNEQRVAERRTQDEIPEGALKRYLCTFFQITKIIRHKAVLHAIQAKRKTSVRRRRRGY